jgi:NAD(P)-dependent dehydrogenase (short-subunit alcohol dehydrogenase family)
MGGSLRKTTDGFESQFGVNHLGHFLLTELLLDSLKASAPSRVVILSSVTHAGSEKNRPTIHFEDLNCENREYSGTEAYAQSKLANVLHAKELARHLEGSGVSVFAVHPGWARSNLVATMMPAWVQNVVMRPFSGLLTMMSNEDAAQTTLFCLLDDEVPQHSGEYFSQKSILYSDKSCRKGGWPMRSPNEHAHDAELAKKLYEVSLEMVGLVVH